MRIIIELDVNSTIHQFCIYKLLESVLGANSRWNPCFHCWRRHRFLTQPELASQYVSTSWELKKLLGNRFSDMDWKARKRTAKKRTERYGIPKFRGFRKSLATSSPHYAAVHSVIMGHLHIVDFGATNSNVLHIPTWPTDGTRGGQTFPKSTEFRNSVAFRLFFGSPFPCFFSPCCWIGFPAVSLSPMTY